MKKTNISRLDMITIEKVLDMESGYVLDFTNQTFARFFADYDVDIDNIGMDGSKAKRFRHFLKNSDNALIATVLSDMLKVRNSRSNPPGSEKLQQYMALINRLHGSQVKMPDTSTSADILDLRYVNELQEKVNRRISSGDLDGAITVARTMLESLLNELHYIYYKIRDNHAGDLQKLFKLVTQAMLANELNPELREAFKQCVRGLVQSVNGIACIRNKMSDGHFREWKPVYHYARLAENVCTTVMSFLISQHTYQEESKNENQL